jgi:hypothetical protein
MQQESQRAVLVSVAAGAAVWAWDQIIAIDANGIYPPAEIEPASFSKVVRLDVCCKALRSTKRHWEV